MEKLYNCNISKIKNYKELFVTNYQADEVIEFTNQLLHGVLTMGYKNIDVLRYNPHELNDFDWNQAPKRSANSFSLYLLGLRHIYLLADAARLRYSRSNLELAEDFVESFYRYLFEQDEQNGMINNDHALSERIENLVYLYSVAKDYHFMFRNENNLISIIEDSVEKLFGAKYYQRNHNHGIIADKAALIGVYFLNNDDMNEKIAYLIDRLKAQVTFAYTKDGIHKENSFDYHVSITGLLLGCLDILRLIDHPYYVELSACLKNANDFMVYALKPNGYRPLFGDSKGTKAIVYQGDGKIKKLDANVTLFGENQYMDYIRSKGLYGLEPPKRLAYFPSGYVYFREHFNMLQYEEATWLSLKAGYTTRVHKHQDDLSICLYSKGYDIFVDSGMYSFMPKDKYKDYMESIPAHSTVGIKGRSYSIANGNGEKFKIQKCFSTQHYDYALASSRVYEDAAIYRHIYYLRNCNIILIHDEFISNEEHEYVQYFHLSNAVTITENNTRRINLTIGDSGYDAVIRQLQPIDAFNILEGEKTEPISILSTGFGSFEETKTLMYIEKGYTTEFLTCVEIKQSTNIDTELFVTKSNVIINDIKIPILHANSVSFYGVDIETTESDIVVKNKGNGKGLKYALYLFGYAQNDAIAKLPYTKDESLVYHNKVREDIILLYYVANDSGELLKGIVGECYYQEDGSVKVKKYDRLHHPFVKGHSIQKMDNGHYKYSVEVEYNYPTMCKWWVYFNGANTSFESNSAYEMTYTFQSPGEYVVMYSFRDRFFGEFVFNQFDKITI